MDDRLLQLGSTGEPADAAIHRAFADGFPAFAALDQLRAFDVGATDRAVLGNLHWPGVLRAALGNHLHHLRDHIAGAADNHRVTDHQAQPRHFIHVVQGRVGHSDPGHLDRLQARHWSHGAGAADLELHVQQLGEFFHGWKLVGNGPARLPSAKAQLAL